MSGDATRASGRGRRLAHPAMVDHAPRMGSTPRDRSWISRDCLGTERYRSALQPGV